MLFLYICNKQVFEIFDVLQTLCKKLNKVGESSSYKKDFNAYTNNKKYIKPQNRIYKTKINYKKNTSMHFVRYFRFTCYYYIRIT